MLMQLPLEQCGTHRAACLPRSKCVALFEEWPIYILYTLYYSAYDGARGGAVGLGTALPAGRWRV